MATPGLVKDHAQTVLTAARVVNDAWRAWEVETLIAEGQPYPENRSLWGSLWDNARGLLRETVALLHRFAPVYGRAAQYRKTPVGSVCPGISSGWAVYRRSSDGREVLVSVVATEAIADLIVAVQPD